MIGLFDSGHGGLTVLRQLKCRFPDEALIYFGDHLNAPYGNRCNQEILELTRAGVEYLFQQGARLVILACNSATAVAARTLQQNWIKHSAWQQHNVLGIIAPTVEVATQVPWTVTTPQYPQKYNSDTIAVFATASTVRSNVYVDEIKKRCPGIKVLQQVCPTLASSIEQGLPAETIEQEIQLAVTSLLQQNQGQPPQSAILGCTHYALVEPSFQNALPVQTRLLSQPEIIADSLEDYLTRHATFSNPQPDPATAQLFTSGDVTTVNEIACRFWPEAPNFQRFNLH